MPRKQFRYRSSSDGDESDYYSDEESDEDSEESDEFLMKEMLKEQIKTNDVNMIEYCLDEGWIGVSKLEYFEKGKEHEALAKLRFETLYFLMNSTGENEKDVQAKASLRARNILKFASNYDKTKYAAIDEGEWFAHVGKVFGYDDSQLTEMETFLTEGNQSNKKTVYEEFKTKFNRP